jgi:hypothetical protein
VEVLFKDLEVDMDRICRCKGEMTMKLVGQQGCALGTQQTKTSQCLQWDNLPTGSVVTSQYPEEPPPPGVTEECPGISLHIQQMKSRKE